MKNNNLDRKKYYYLILKDDRGLDINDYFVNGEYNIGCRSPSVHGIINNKTLMFGFNKEEVFFFDAVHSLIAEFDNPYLVITPTFDIILDFNLKTDKHSKLLGKMENKKYLKHYLKNKKEKK